jgi:putative tryptophan/tyrosine transport system substrate-binding protein
MRRREFIKLVGGAAAGWPLVARAQQSERVRRIGVLMASADPVAQSYVTAFRGALTKLGWAEGSNLRTEVRWGAGDPAKIQSLAKELVELRLDVIVGQSTPGVAALVRETQIIPIVFANVADPIGSGFVASLVRPGGNLTGRHRAICSGEFDPTVPFINRGPNRKAPQKLCEFNPIRFRGKADMPFWGANVCF